MLPTAVLSCSVRCLLVCVIASRDASVYVCVQLFSEGLPLTHLIFCLVMARKHGHTHVISGII